MPPRQPAPNLVGIKPERAAEAVARDLALPCSFVYPTLRHVQQLREFLNSQEAPAGIPWRLGWIFRSGGGSCGTCANRHSPIPLVCSFILYKSALVKSRSKFLDRYHSGLVACHRDAEESSCRCLRAARRQEGRQGPHGPVDGSGALGTGPPGRQDSLGPSEV